MNNIIKNINRFDALVWSKYRVEIIKIALKTIIENNSSFRNYLYSTEDKMIFFEDFNVYWGAEKNIFLTDAKNNYYGKLLTILKLQKES